MTQRLFFSRLFALLLAGCLLAVSAGQTRADTVTVFAAASLGGALQDVATGFEAQSGHRVVVSLAGSSVLARQIEQGAPADVFISASLDWMNRVEQAGRIDAQTRFNLLGNRLVLIAHGRNQPPVTLDPSLDLVALLGPGRLAMALVDAVPAGIYGKAALEALGLWDSVAPHVAQADNARAALVLVARGAAPFGVVYATDAAASEAVSIVATFPDTSHPPIVYPAAAIDPARPAARAFLSFLRGPTARAIFERHGFAVIAE